MSTLVAGATGIAAFFGLLVLRMPIAFAMALVGDDCQLIIDGDYNVQVDLQAFEGNNNGMRRVSEVFRGQSFYGEVELPIIYRSKMAEWAENL